MTTLSIVIPAYNEEARLPSYLAQIQAFLAAQELRYELIVVDDGSSDGTAAVVEGAMAENSSLQLVKLPENRGKGYAVRAGMLRATGALRLFADADGATPITELPRLRDAIEAGADVAIGSRSRKSEQCTVRARLHRKVIGSVFNGIVSTLAVQEISDTQCGFKLFTAGAAAALFPLQCIEGFGFDVELLFLCRKKGYSVAEVPVNWSDMKGSKVHLVRDSLRMLGDLFTIRGNDLRGAYGSTGGEPILALTGKEGPEP